MNINIQTVHFDADEKLLEFVGKKVQKLATFHDRITRVDVFLKLDNSKKYRNGKKSII